MNELNHSNFVDLFLAMPDEKKLIWLKTMSQEETQLFSAKAEELLLLELNPTVKSRIINIYTGNYPEIKKPGTDNFLSLLHQFTRSTDYQLKLAAKSALKILADKNYQDQIKFSIPDFPPPTKLKTLNSKNLGILGIISLLLFFSLSRQKQEPGRIIEFQPSSSFAPYREEATNIAPKNNTALKELKNIRLSAVAGKADITEYLPDKPEPVKTPENKTPPEDNTKPAIKIPEFSRPLVWDINLAQTDNYPIKITPTAKQEHIKNPDSSQIENQESSLVSTITSEPFIEETLPSAATSATETQKTPIAQKITINNSVLNHFSDMQPGTEKNLIMEKLYGLPLNTTAAEDSLKISPRLLDEPSECQLSFREEKLQKTTCQIKIAQRDPKFPLQNWGEILQQKLKTEGLHLKRDNRHPLNWSLEKSGRKYSLILSETVFHDTRIFAAELKSEAIYK